MNGGSEDASEAMLEHVIDGVLWIETYSSGIEPESSRWQRPILPLNHELEQILDPDRYQ